MHRGSEGNATGVQRGGEGAAKGTSTRESGISTTGGGSTTLTANPSGAHVAVCVREVGRTLKRRDKGELVGMCVSCACVSVDND